MEIDMNTVYAQADIHKDAKFNFIADWGKWTTTEKDSEFGATRTYKFLENADEIKSMTHVCKAINEAVDKQNLPHIWAQIIDHGGMISMEVIGQNGVETKRQRTAQIRLQKLLVETIVHPPEKRRPGKQKLEDAKPR